MNDQLGHALACMCTVPHLGLSTPMPWVLCGRRGYMTLHGRSDTQSSVGNRTRKEIVMAAQAPNLSASNELVTTLV